MDRNVKIAKELVKLAKILVAYPRSDYKKMTRYQQYENEELAEPLAVDSLVAEFENEYKRVKSLLMSNDISELDIPIDLQEDLTLAKDIVEKENAGNGENKEHNKRILDVLKKIDNGKMGRLKEAVELKHEVDDLYEEGVNGHEEYYDAVFENYKDYIRYIFSFYAEDCGAKELNYYKREFQNAIDHWKQCPNIVNWMLSIYNSGEKGREDVEKLGYNDRWQRNYLERRAYYFLHSLKVLGYKYNENYKYDEHSTQFLK